MKTRRENKIPASLHLDLPDCSRIFILHPEYKEHTRFIQIFAKARIPNILRSQREYPLKKTACFEKP